MALRGSGLPPAAVGSQDPLVAQLLGVIQGLQNQIAELTATIKELKGAGSWEPSAPPAGAGPVSPVSVPQASDGWQQVQSKAKKKAAQKRQNAGLRTDGNRPAGSAANSVRLQAVSAQTERMERRWVLTQEEWSAPVFDYWADITLQAGGVALASPQEAKQAQVELADSAVPVAIITKDQVNSSSRKLSLVLRSKPEEGSSPLMKLEQRWLTQLGSEPVRFLPLDHSADSTNDRQEAQKKCEEGSVVITVVAAQLYMEPKAWASMQQHGAREIKDWVISAGLSTGDILDIFHLS